MDCHPEWTVILSETKDLCIAAGTNHLQRSFAAHRMTRFGKISTVFLQEHLTYVIVRTFTQLYVQLWRRDAATTAAGTAALHFATLRGRCGPLRCGILPGGHIRHVGQVCDLAAGGVGDVDACVIEQQPGGAIKFDA